MKFAHLAELQQLHEANKPLLAKVIELGKAGGLEDDDLDGMVDARQINKKIYVISKDKYEPDQFIMNVFHISKDGKSGDWGGTPMDEFKSKKEALVALAALKESKCDHVGFWQPIASDDPRAKAGNKWRCFNCGAVTKETPAEMSEELITEVQVRLKPATRVKALDHFGSETENPGGHRDIKNTMKFLDIESLAKDKLHSIDSDGNAADFKKHARNLGFKELEYPDNNDAKLAGFERVGVKNGTTFWKKGNALLLLAKDTPPTFMIKEGQEQLTEGAGNLARSIENWMEATKTYHFESERGVRNFTKLVGILGYRSLEDFLADNSGAIEALVHWIGSANMPEWKEKFAEFDQQNDDGDDDEK